MRILDQAAMNQLFAVTDEIPLDREKITVPLERVGEGDVALSGGKFEIVLPDVDDLGPFLAALPGRIAALSAEPG